MKADIAWWSLRESTQTIDSLNARLHDRWAARWSDIPGLRCKLWISDRATQRWGAIMIWDDVALANGRLPSNEALELIGCPFAQRERFTVEAVVEPHAGSHNPPPRVARLLGHSYIVVDTLTRTPLQDRPVAVVLDCDDLTTEQMQRVARETNLSETTFVCKPKQGGHAHVRIFTPVSELSFAEPALLGAAVALAEIERRDALVLETASGLVSLQVRFDADDVAYAKMRQPIPSREPYDQCSVEVGGYGTIVAEGTLRA